MTAPSALAPFQPKTMQLSLLTAALQELTPRDDRDADPDLAVEQWLEYARRLNCPNIQLSAALHPSLASIAPEALLDPVANTLDLRQPFTPARAQRVAAAMKSTGVGLSDLAYFDNMLAANAAARAEKHKFMLRVFDAAVLLETPAVCGFVGRNPDVGLDANLDLFESQFIPLLREAKDNAVVAGGLARYVLLSSRKLNLPNRYLVSRTSRRSNRLARPLIRP